MGYPSQSAMVVGAVGACTCLGDAIPAAAGARAGLRRSSEFDGFGYFDEATNDGIPLVGYAIRGVSDGFQGMGRLIRVGAMGLEDLQANAPWLKPDQAGIFLALPRLKPPVTGEGVEDDGEDSPRASRLPRSSVAPVEPGIGDEILAGITVSAFEGVTPMASAVFMEDRHGALLALQAALTALRQGQCETALVGACDSALDEDRLTEALASGRIKTDVNPVGFMPGEASAFLLLERRRSAASRGTPQTVVIGDPVFDIEKGSFVADAKSTGRGLSQAAAAALGRLANPAGAFGSVFIDVNGEPYRSSDWGQAAIRLRAQGLLQNWSEQVAALSFGETGAASPVLALVLAARAFARGYGAGDTALVLSSDDDGKRGAMILQHDGSAAR